MAEREINKWERVSTFRDLNSLALKTDLDDPKEQKDLVSAYKKICGLGENGFGDARVQEAMKGMRTAFDNNRSSNGSKKAVAREFVNTLITGAGVSKDVVKNALEVSGLNSYTTLPETKPNTAGSSAPDRSKISIADTRARPSLRERAPHSQSEISKKDGRESLSDTKEKVDLVRPKEPATEVTLLAFEKYLIDKRKKLIAAENQDQVAMQYFDKEISAVRDRLMSLATKKIGRIAA